MDNANGAGASNFGWGRLVLWILGALLALAGLGLAVGGLRLVSLGGSWYYLIAGSALLVAGMLIATEN